MLEMRLICAVCFLTIPVMQYLFMRNETKSHKNIILGVTLPFEARQEEKVARLLADYKKHLLWAMLALTLTGAVCLLPSLDSVMLTCLLFWTNIAVVLPMLLYAGANRRLFRMKQENNWISPDAGVTVVDLKAVAEPIHRVRLIWFILPVLIGLIPVILSIVDGFSPLFGLCATNAVIILFFILFHKIIERQRKDVVEDDMPLTIALTRARRQQWSKMWLIMSWLTAGFNIGCYASAGSIGFDDGNAWPFLLVTLGYVMLTLFFCIQTEFAARAAQQRLTRESGKAAFVDEDAYWLFGLFYNNPNDNHFVIQNRIGIGTTVNIAHAGGKVLMAVSALLLLAMPFLGFFMMAEETSPIRMTVSPTQFIARHNGTVYEIERGEIQSVSLIEQREPMRKDWGTDFSHLYKGTFTVGQIGECQIILDPTSTPYIRVDTPDGTYLFGSANPEETMRIYAELSS